MLEGLKRAAARWREAGPASQTLRPEPFWEQPVRPETVVDPAAMTLFAKSAFPGDNQLPWLDQNDADAAIERELKAGAITAAEAETCRKWARDGYLILNGFYGADELDSVWADYEAHIADGRARPPLECLFEGDIMPGRMLNGHFSVAALDRMLFEPRINRLISLLLGAKARPFQTIVGHKSSQQLAHSDSIHMTTYPNGYLAATWVAFEDVHPGSGPLTYYPGSHKLPYLLADEVGIERGGHGYDQYHSRYEPAVQAAIRDNDLRVSYFIPKKGDVLIWHANLLHGGSKILTPGLSRKALVCHYLPRAASAITT